MELVEFWWLRIFFFSRVTLNDCIEMPNYGQNGTMFFNVAFLWFSFLIHELSCLSQNNCTNFIFVLTVWVLVMGAAHAA